jgi:hypothetical protein
MRSPEITILLSLLALASAVPTYPRSNLRGSIADQNEQDTYLDSIRHAAYIRPKRPLIGVQYGWRESGRSVVGQLTPTSNLRDGHDDVTPLGQQPEKNSRGGAPPAESSKHNNLHRLGG